MAPPPFDQHAHHHPGRNPNDFRNYVPQTRSSLSRYSTPRPSRSEDGRTHAITAMSLPGLGLQEPEEQSANNFGAGSQAQTQIYDLKKETEWRFEVALGRVVTVKVVGGKGEIFGTELVLGKSYQFASSKVAIFTWTNCNFEVTSDYGTLSSALVSEYVAEETPNHEYLNIHFALDTMRSSAAASGREGPRVLVVGPENSGKSALVKTLAGYGIRVAHGPLVANLDPKEGLLTLPGTLSVVHCRSLIDVEDGWGNAPMSGPNGEIPVKVPLVYYYGSMIPEEKGGSIYKAQIRRVALAVAGKMNTDPEARAAGVLIDAPASLVNPNATANGYDLLDHIVSEFGISGILCLGSERLSSDLARKFDGAPTSLPVPAGQEPDTISVVRVTKSGGVAERDSAYLRAVREAQVKNYFYGDTRVGAGIALQPRQQQVDFDTITVWRRISSTGSGASMAYASMGAGNDEESFLPGGADDSEYEPQVSMVPLPASQIFERLTAPLPALRNCVLAVMNCEPEPEAGTEQNVLRDSSVMGFLYVTDVDETRGRINLLSPVAGRVPHRALVWAEGIDGVLGLT